MISSKVKRNVAAIAYTELSALTSGISKAVPFFGFLLGFAYIGHAVWVFEDMLQRWRPVVGMLMC